MRPNEIPVVFEPSGRRAFVLPGTSLLEAAGETGLALQTPCGGQGTCGQCRVRVLSGEIDAPADRGPFSAKQWADGYRLACQTRVLTEAVIEIPERSRLGGYQKILTHDTGHRTTLKPWVRRVPFALPTPSAQDSVSDVGRLLRTLGDFQVATPVRRTLPVFLRCHAWKGTAIVAGKTIMALDPPGSNAGLYGIAVDLGTTTLVATLVDLTNGRELALASCVNPQVAYGDDVISRIQKIRQSPDNLTRQREAVRDAVNQLIRTTTSQAGVSPDRIYDAVIVGNSTMQQIFCGYDPSALGELPFVAAFERGHLVPASALGLDVHPHAAVFVYPQIGGFVGGDTVAGMVAARIDQWQGPVLLIDIGTNGEIVLTDGSRLLATSTAAGPAFEGARITQGMRATVGAIEKVLLREDVLINVIGNVAPVGLCGTALIDAAADLLRVGIVDETGRILGSEKSPCTLPENLRRRIRTDGRELCFVLADADETGTGRPICLWQRDLRELQLAAGAIRAGINVLLKRLGMNAESLTAILLAGAFGHFIRRSNARRIGMIPAVPTQRIRCIGNAASLGAKMALLSVDERAYAERLRQKAEHVDLSQDPEFQAAFAAAMLFPSRELFQGDNPSQHPRDSHAGAESGTMAS